MAWRSKPESGGGATRDAIENVIGRSCIIRGDLTADGAFRIDGTIEGSVESQASVVVGESGVVRGGVRGTDVVIAGTVQGDVICAGHLEILAKGKVEGDIAREEHAHRDRRRVPRNQPHGRTARGATTSGRDPGLGRSELRRVARWRAGPATRPVDLDRILKAAAQARQGKARWRIMVASDPSRPVRTFTLPRLLPTLLSLSRSRWSRRPSCSRSDRGSCRGRWARSSIACARWCRRRTASRSRPARPTRAAALGNGAPLTAVDAASCRPPARGSASS